MLPYVFFIHADTFLQELGYEKPVAMSQVSYNCSLVFRFIVWYSTTLSYFLHISMSDFVGNSSVLMLDDLKMCTNSSLEAVHACNENCVLPNRRMVKHSRSIGKEQQPQACLGLDLLVPLVISGSFYLLDQVYICQQMEV